MRQNYFNWSGEHKPKHHESLIVSRSNRSTGSTRGWQTTKIWHMATEISYKITAESAVHCWGQRSRKLQPRLIKMILLNKNIAKIVLANVAMEFIEATRVPV